MHGADVGIVVREVGPLEGRVPLRQPVGEEGRWESELLVGL